MPKPFTVVFICGSNCQARFRRAVKEFKDAKTFVILWRSADNQPDIADAPAGKNNISVPVNEYEPLPDEQYLMLLDTDPQAQLDFTRVFGIWCRRFSNRIQVQREIADGKFETIADIGA